LDEDAELNMINARKLAELKRRAERSSIAPALSASAAPAKPAKSDRDVLLGVLYDRGDEVLQTAYQAYPRQTEMVVAQLARLLKQRFSLKTTIKIQDKGKFVDLKDKLKMDMEEG
jgi:hypothetical protein